MRLSFECGTYLFYQRAGPACFLQAPAMLSRASFVQVDTTARAVRRKEARAKHRECRAELNRMVGDLCLYLQHRLLAGDVKEENDHIAFPQLLLDQDVVIAAAVVHHLEPSPLPVQQNVSLHEPKRVFTTKAQTGAGAVSGGGRVSTFSFSFSALLQR